MVGNISKSTAPCLTFSQLSLKLSQLTIQLSLTGNVSRRKSLAGGRALRTQGSTGSRRTSNFLELPGNFRGDEV